VLSCLRADSDDPIFGGGPAGGFCTHACAQDDDCPGMDSTCFKNGNVESGRCTLACQIGPPLLQDYDRALDPNKCRGRADLRCEEVKGTGAVCIPTCGSDLQCSPGRFCDPRRAVCVSDPSAGLPTGAACDSSVSPTTCAGRCVDFDFGISSCSSPCVLGGASLESPDCGGHTEGLCAFGPPADGAGDLGYCTRSCTAHSDCQNPAFWCFSVQGFTAQLGVGYCFGASPCISQDDCNALSKEIPYICTATPHGSFCLDKAFPFDKADAGAGGSELP
jgi:hypothetical protein